MGLLPPLRADVRRRRPRPQARKEGRRGPVRGDHRAGEKGARGEERHRAHRRRPAGARPRLQGGHQGEDRPRLRGGPARPALEGGRRGLRLLAERPRDRLPEAQPHPRRLGHRRQRPGDGLRQYGRGLRHRRGVHARRGHRREALLRRVPPERPGRGRRRRHQDSEPDREARRGDAPRLRGAREDLPQAREALPRYAGPRVHDPEGEALASPDALRQADRLRRGAHRGGDGEGGADREDEALRRIDPMQLNQLLRPSSTPPRRRGRPTGGGSWRRG